MDTEIKKSGLRVSNIKVFSSGPKHVRVESDHGWVVSSRFGVNVVNESHRFSLLINSLTNFSDRVDFEVSLRLGLRF